MSETIHSRLAKAKLTRIQSFIKEHPLESNITAIQFETKLCMLESAFQEFCFCHNEIFKTLTDGMKEEHAKYYTSVEEIFLQADCTLKSYIAARRLDFHSGSVLTKFNQPYQIELEPPIFSDDFSEWDSLTTNIHSLVKTSTTECPICTDQFHKLYHCQIFKEWDITSRRIFVNQNNYCCNCLLSTHKVTSCRSKYTCHECKKKHHTALHTPPAVKTKCKPNKSQMFKNSGQSKQSNFNRDYNSSQATTTSTSQTILKPKQSQKMSYNSGHSNQQSSNQNCNSLSTTNAQSKQKMFHNPNQFIQSISNQDYSLSTNTTTPASSKTNIKQNQPKMMSENPGNNNSHTINQDSRSSTIENNTTTHALKKTSLDASEILQEVRILFNSASQDSFSSEHCIQPQLQRENVRNVSNGTNNSKGVFSGEVQFSRTRVNPDTKITLDPKVQLQISDTNINSNQLAKVDITIETNHALELLLPGLISTPAGHSIITNPLVDWIVSGSRNIPSNTSLPSSIQNHHTSFVDTDLQNNWEIEEVKPLATKSTPEAEPKSACLCEQDTTTNFNKDETFITHEESTKLQQPILQDNNFLLSNINIDQHKLKFVNSPEKSQFIKTSGLIWKYIHILFYFQVHLSPVSTIQLISGLDSSGYLTKAIIQSKLFQERLFQIKWNDDLPTTLQIYWNTFVSAFHKLEYIKSKSRLFNNSCSNSLNKSSKIHFNSTSPAKESTNTQKTTVFQSTIAISSTTISGLHHTFFSHHALKKSTTHQVVFQHNKYKNCVFLLTQQEPK